MAVGAGSRILGKDGRAFCVDERVIADAGRHPYRRRHGASLDLLADHEPGRRSGLGLHQQQRAGDRPEQMLQDPGAAGHEPAVPADNEQAYLLALDQGEQLGGDVAVAERDVLDAAARPGAAVGQGPADELFELARVLVVQGVRAAVREPSAGSPSGSSIPRAARKLRTPSWRGLPSTYVR